jgi:hypothetical protein
MQVATESSGKYMRYVVHELQVRLQAQVHSPSAEDQHDALKKLTAT